MSKLITILITILLGLPALGSTDDDYSVEIINNSSSVLTLGRIDHRISLPSLCKDGFCWEELFPYEKAVHSDAREIIPDSVVSLFEIFEDVKVLEGNWLTLFAHFDEGHVRISLLTCKQLEDLELKDKKNIPWSYDPSNYVRLSRENSEIHIDADRYRVFCVSPGMTKIEVLD